MSISRRLAPTDGQLDIITRLMFESQDASRHVEDYLHRTGLMDIGDLSMRQASELIDSIKKISAKIMIERYLSTKQLVFIDQLQDTAQRRGYIGEFLNSRGKKSINSLSSSEASELIAVLKSMRPPNEGEKLDAPMTLDQIDILNNLQDTEERRGITERFLNQILRKDMKELTRQEAEELIGLLE